MIDNLLNKVTKHAQEAETSWSGAYALFDKLLIQRQLRVGAEIGVAFAGHAENILTSSGVQRLYGVDPYKHFDAYDDPMNVSQEEFDAIFEFVQRRMRPFGERYAHLRMLSQDACNNAPDNLDFVYIDAVHSYEGVRSDLKLWYKKVREGGIIGGHDYSHVNFPGVQQAIDEFFGRFQWNINVEGEGVWWVEKKRINISYFIPAFNCAETITESVNSIMETNFQDGDELVIVNDASNHETVNVIESVKKAYPEIKFVNHRYNTGGGAARNTAIQNCAHPIVFCLDSDNVLAPHSMQSLKNFLIHEGLDIASFGEIHYFQKSTADVTHKWVYPSGVITFQNQLSSHVVPSASGNYLYTIESWKRAGGYPEFAGALDAWGFGLRQLACRSRMACLPGSFYFHRHGYDSYWVRESRNGTTSLKALQILLPYIDQVDARDVRYILSRKGRKNWFDALPEHPIRIASPKNGALTSVLKLDPILMEKVIYFLRKVRKVINL